MPHTLMGRVFGLAYSAPYAALTITYTAGGKLLELTSPRAVFLIAGTGAMLALAVVWRMLQPHVADNRR